MKNFFKQFFLKVIDIWPVLILTAVFLAISIANSHAGTWLSGWDNLHPEFDFGLNLKRSFFASWQEYQGLGLMGGMGHAADLPRQLILWIFSLFLPSSFLRYFYHFLMLYLGSLGIYFLLSFLLAGKGKKKLSALAGSVFYLFNLATIQLFYVPFEAFSHHFASLPWLFLVNLNFLEKRDKKSLIFLLLVNLLAVPQGYVGTFFAVYLMAWGLASFVYLLQNKGSLKRVLLSFAFIFITNAFWLLPNLYFVFSDVNITVQSKISQMTTEDNLLKNKKYGDLKNVVLLKGFWFDTTETSENGTVNYLMAPWTGHLENPVISFFGFLLFFLGTAGALISFLKFKKLISFLPVFFLSFLVLANETPVISLLSKAFFKLPLFSQMFRFPFTKFSALLAFCLSLYFGAFCFWLSSKANSKKSLLIIVLLAFLPVFYLYPVFQGKLFYPRVKARIPENYFELFSYLKKSGKDGRIADFPQSSFWGWSLYRWNYTGSGFIWYGINQPILDRNFDMWSSQNENYYWEMSYALFSRKNEIFEKIFDKYQIEYALVDKNIYNTGNYKALGFDELEEMFSSPKFSLEKTFGNILLYKVNLDYPIENYVFISTDTAKVASSYRWGSYDRAFLDLGIYSEQKEADYYYPFRSIFTGRGTEGFDFNIKETKDSFIFSKEVPQEVLSYELRLPDFDGRELIWVNPGDFSDVKYLIPKVNVQGRNIEVIVPKVGGYFSGEVNPTAGGLEAKNCNQFSFGTVKNEIANKQGNNFLRLSAVNSTNCSATFSFENLLHKFGYLIKVENENVKGKSLLFWLENQSARRADQEFYLQKEGGEKFIIQPPMQKSGIGYRLHFDNISIGRHESVNDLGMITINPIPYYFLSGIRFQKDVSLAPIKYMKAESSHPNPSLYKIDVPPRQESLLVLSQSYHEGWKAYFEGESLIKRPAFLLPLVGREINDHVLVNNWENGWVLPGSENESRVVLIFIPQYLQYFGFTLLLATISAIVALNQEKIRVY
ncbi:hypothetical protein C4578_02350 [Candidatus Microgenomates bacterium]|jgi:hypothetical protein|nr:MAG: hypothetical protein C4578_02350 [Candidatus Microgenomates bacterium]